MRMIKKCKMSLRSVICMTSVITPGVNLSHYETFRIETHAADPAQAVKTKVGQALERDLTTELLRHGLRAAPKNSELVFSYATERRTQYMGEHGGEFQEGALEIHAVDATNGRTVWITHAQAVIDPSDKSHRQLSIVVKKAFRKYPYLLRNSPTEKNKMRKPTLSLGGLL
jgi:hypothetical protein